jgi:hypothetical protein
MSDTTRRRRLTLADILLFVAVTAAGLVVVRMAIGMGLYEKEAIVGAGPVRLFIEGCMIFGAPLLVAWTLLLLVLSLITPRPSLRHVIRRPGFVACAAVLAALLDRGAFFGSRVLSDNSAAELAVTYANTTTSVSEHAGLMILGAWLALALGRRWRPGPSWLDWLGCCLGLCWVVLFLSGEVYWFVVRVTHIRF